MRFHDSAFVHADDETVEWVRRVFDDCDRADAAAYASHYAEDATFAWNGDVARGRTAIEERFAAFFGGVIEGLEHVASALWSIEPGDGGDELVTMENDVVYTLPDGRTVTAYGSTILERVGDEVAEARVYIDVSALYEAPADERPVAARY